jgi:TonB-dependent starch-binding outer membrane protein SusC
MMYKLIKMGLRGIMPRRVQMIGLVCLMLVLATGFTQSFGNGMNMQGQSITVTGVVTDQSTGESLPGVSILVKGTLTGTVSDLNGRYSINVPDPSNMLVFSFIGYNTREIVVGNQRTINVSLTTAIAELDEVVVIGYGQARRRDITGAITSIRVDDIGDLNVTNFGEAIQGLVAGVQVRGTGQPGAEPSMEIRGIGNFSNNEPLYIIDGLPTRANRDFNVGDIESIQIIKDASAAAIYGSRAANGVVIITTKSGREGPLRVNFSSNTSQEWLPRFDLMDRDTWIEFNNRAYDAVNRPRQNHFDGNTDWQDVTFQNALRTDNNLTFSGGGESGTYLLSLNHQTNEGTTIGSNSDRLAIRVNTKAQKGIFVIGQNLAISNFTVANLNTNPIADVTRMLPTIPLYNENNPGGFGYGDENRARTFGVNPVAREALEDSETRNQRIRGNAFAELNWPTLQYRFNYGLDYTNNQHDFLRKVGNWTLNQPIDPSRIYAEKGRYESHLFENTLSFRETFASHRITALLGQSYQTFYEDRVWGEGQNVIQAGGQYFSVLNATTANARVGGWYNEGALLSFFGRMNYNYNDRYIAEFTMRYDGTSRLPLDNRWEYFPSISGAWRISEENFFNVSWIDDLKINASYGRLGSSNIGYYDYQSVLNINPQYVFGANNLQNGITTVRLVNQDLRWEMMEQINLGLESVLLGGRLIPTLNFYQSETRDVLTNMPILWTTGNDGGEPLGNAASLRNTGFELDMTWRDRIEASNLNYSVGFNFGSMKNEIVDLGYGNEVFYTWQTINEIGQPIGMYYLIQTMGLFQNEQEVQSHTNSAGQVIQPNARPGDIRYLDANDDGRITGDDRVIVGNPWPKFEYGLNIAANWNNLDFRMVGYGAHGFDIFNGPRSLMDRFDDNSAYRAGVQPWTPENPNTDFPRIIYADDRNSRGDIDRWLEDGSFFKIRQITLGYTIPTAWFGGYVNRMRISATAQNLITITKYTGLDPEFRAPNLFQRTYDNHRFPTPKAVTFSIQLDI